MRRFLQKLQYVKLKDILSVFTMLTAYPYAVFLKRKRPHIWLFCEDRNEARDNGLIYKDQCAVCIEPEFYPDCPHLPQFADLNPIVTPEKPLVKSIIYKFS